MTVQQIVDQIKLLYPAATVWTDAQIVSQMNYEQVQIMHDLLVESIHDMITRDGVRRYTMPSDMRVDFIRHVMVQTGTSITAQAGTISITAGTKNVVGVGTSFASTLEGQRITIGNEVFTVDTVTDGTHMTVTANAEATATDSAWSLFTAPEEETAFIEYPFIEYNEVLTRGVGRGWYRVDSDTIGIYPTPGETGQAIRIVYLPKPTEMSTSAMSAEPELYYRWHMLLVYAVIREIAMSGNNPDTNIANNYAALYNTLMLAAKQDRAARNTAKYRQTPDVIPQWNRYRRSVVRYRRRGY